MPAIDILAGSCVRLKQGRYTDVTSYSDEPTDMARCFTSQGATYLHIVDLDGAKNGKPINFDAIIELKNATDADIQVGGGIRNFKDAVGYLANGVNRVILGSAALSNPELPGTLVKKFGPDRIAVSIDVRDGKVSTEGWTSEPEFLSKELLKKMKNIGIEILCVTDISRDGMMQGPNFKLIKEVLGYGFKVIAAGGICRESQLAALEKMGCYGAIVGKAVYEGRIRIDRNYLGKRIIPCMDVKNGRVVKGVKFVNLRDAGDPVELAKFYSDAGADELVFLDIGATVDDKNLLYKLVENVAREINIPFTVGGGIRNFKQVQKLLYSGADKVSIGAAAVKNPGFVSELSRRYGAQCIVISLDCKKTGESWELFINAGTLPTGIDAVKFAKKMELAGAGELLVNSLDRDGTKQGYDLDLLQSVAKAVNIPVIASSGAGCEEDFLKAFITGGCDAALAAGLFHFGEIKIAALKQYLAKNMITVRI